MKGVIMDKEKLKKAILLGLEILGRIALFLVQILSQILNQKHSIKEWWCVPSLF